MCSLQLLAHQKRMSKPFLPGPPSKVQPYFMYISLVISINLLKSGTKMVYAASLDYSSVKGLNEYPFPSIVHAVICSKMTNVWQPFLTAKCASADSLRFFPWIKVHIFLTKEFLFILKPLAWLANWFKIFQSDTKSMSLLLRHQSCRLKRFANPICKG